MEQMLRGPRTGAAGAVAPTGRAAGAGPALHAMRIGAA